MQTIKTKQYTRTHIDNPSTEEINKLIKEFELHELIVEDLIERKYEDKVEIYDNIISVSLNFPKYKSQTKKYILNPFHILVTQSHVVTISKFPSKNIERLIETAKRDKLDPSDEDISFDVIYEVINTMYDKSIKGLNKASRAILQLQEHVLHSKMPHQDYLEILMTKKLNMVALTHMFRPQRETLVELNKALKRIHGANTHKEEEYGLYIDDLDAKLDKILNNTSKTYETVKSLADTYDTILSIKTNRNIVILTIFTAITGILTLIVGAYGMNVPLPGAESPMTFAYLCAGMLGIAGGLLVFFRKRKWI